MTEADIHSTIHHLKGKGLSFLNEGNQRYRVSEEFYIEIAEGLPAVVSTCLYTVFLCPSPEYMLLISFVMGGDGQLIKHLRVTSPLLLEFG